jgi:hypothetical protein
MDRRGFLGSLMAVTTAIASGVKLPTGAEVATGKALPKPLAVQNDLLAMLEECHVISISCHQTYDGPMHYEVEYIHAPGGKKGEDTLMVDGYTKDMRPIDVSYKMTAGELMRVTVIWA